MKWEYRELTIAYVNRLGFIDRLNMYGLEGWEVVSIKQGHEHWEILVKRKIE